MARGLDMSAPSQGLSIAYTADFEDGFVEGFFHGAAETARVGRRWSGGYHLSGSAPEFPLDGVKIRRTLGGLTS
jgi:hypothetical protein